MKGSEFIRKLKKLAEERGVHFSYFPDKGKGSHGGIKFGDKTTIIRNPKDELKTGTFEAMCKQLGISKKGLQG